MSCHFNFVCFVEKGDLGSELQLKLLPRGWGKTQLVNCLALPQHLSINMTAIVYNTIYNTIQ